MKINSKHSARADLKRIFAEHVAPELTPEETKAFFLAFGPPTEFEYEKGSNVAYLNGEIEEGLDESCRQMLEDMADHDKIVINLNSPGGTVYVGMGVANMLANSGKHITVNVLGMAYSAASFLIQGATKRRMAPGAIIGIHPAHTIAFGDSDDLRSVANRLQTTDKAILEIYATRVPAENMGRVKKLMKEDTAMLGEEAVELGLADDIISQEERNQIKNSYDALRNKGSRQEVEEVPEAAIKNTYAQVFARLAGNQKQAPKIPENSVIQAPKSKQRVFTKAQLELADTERKLNMYNRHNF